MIRLAEAAHWLLDQDGQRGNDLASVREGLISFLIGLPGRDAKPDRIGPYEVIQELAAHRRPFLLLGRDDDRPVFLRCYPKSVPCPRRTPC